MSKSVPYLSVLGLLACMIAPARAQSVMALPPSPIGDGVHDFYDRTSRCWVWDSEAVGPRHLPEDANAFQTASRCDGIALEGDAELTWISARRNGEIWKGQFQAGRFTGKAIEIYAEGTRIEGQYEKGERVGIWSRTYHDGSRFEFPLVPYRVPRGTLFRPDGTRIDGVYDTPRLDLQASPPVAYPPISFRLNEQGIVFVTLKVLEDGTVEDVRLARSSGFPRLDEAALNVFRLRHYSPGTVDGKPIASYVSVTQSFSLSSSRP